MLEVYLLKQGAQNAVKLSLPAANYELVDALEKAGVTNERDIYNVEVAGGKLDFIPQFIPDSANLYELNILARRLAAMSSWEIDCFEGMVMMDAIKTAYAPITVERLINMTHSTADCQIAYEAHDDETLGRFYAENEFVPELEALPEKIFPWLDYAKIGKELREAEGGVFTPNGYVVHSGEMSRQHSSEHLLLSKFVQKGKAVSMTKFKKIALALLLVLMATMLFSTTVFAAGGDVAGAIEGTWNDASGQIKTVVNKVVFPAIDLILAVFFFAKLGMAYFDCAPVKAL